MKIIHMQYRKDTKNTYVYQEIDKVDGNILEDFETHIPTLYIRKQVFGRNHPKHITITIDEGLK